LFRADTVEGDTRVPPQRLGDVLDPANRDTGQIHLDQGLLDRALAPPVTLDNGRLERLGPKLRDPQLDLAVNADLILAGMVINR
jgi:hypothetical protein